MTSGTADRVLAGVTDLFFVARIRETARLTGVPLAFTRTVDDLIVALAEPARFLILDLTSPVDHAPMLDAAAAAGVPVLGFTTHALAAETRRWHARCARVVTKETLTRELPGLLREGIAR